MPASDTICISFGNSIAAFYVVYASAAVALLAALAVLADWSVGLIKRTRLASQAKPTPRARLIESQA